MQVSIANSYFNITSPTVMAFGSFFRISPNFLEFNLKFLFYVGLWPGEHLSKRQALLYKTYEITLHMFSLTYLVLTTLGTYQIKDDWIKFLDNLDKTFCGYQFTSKVLVFMLKREQMKLLIKEITVSGDTVSEKNKRLMIVHVVLVTVGTMAVVGTFSLLALFKRQMIVEAWLPFDPLKNMLNYFMSYQIIFHTFAIPISCRSMAMQGIVCSIAIYLCDQFVSLQTRLKGLEYSKLNEALMRSEFKEIIKKHIRLMRYSKLTSSTFEEYFMIQSIAVSIEICFNAMVITMVELEQLSLLSAFISFLAMALINGYIYCYLGNEMVIQSEGIAAAAYETSWTSWPLDMQKDLLLLITVAQRPLGLSAAGIFTISMEAYTQALYNGYSVFAVLSDFVE